MKWEEAKKQAKEDGLSIGRKKWGARWLGPCLWWDSTGKMFVYVPNGARGTTGAVTFSQWEPDEEDKKAKDWEVF